jgi:dolichol-phosphate mannosyltransferase
VSSVAATPRILVTLATYNERDNLTPLIQEIHAAVPAAEVLVIDDNSPDGTGQLADELSASDPRIHV